MAANDTRIRFYRGGEVVSDQRCASENLRDTLKAFIDAEYAVVETPGVNSGAATRFGLAETQTIRLATAEDIKGAKFLGPDRYLAP